MRGNLALRVLCVLLLGLWPCHAGAQFLHLFDVDSWEYPLVRAKFLAFDSSGQRLSRFVPEDLEVREDGAECEVLRVTCPDEIPREPLSVVLTIDISNGWCRPALPEIKQIAKAFVEAMPLGLMECAITSFNRIAYLNQDFTTDRQALFAAIDRLTDDGSADLNAAFLYPLTGALEVCKEGKGRKIVILITDGCNYDVRAQEIVDRATQLGITIFGSGPCGACLPLPDICSRTGGMAVNVYYHDHYTTLTFFRYLDHLDGTAPCEIEWLSDGCNTFRRVRLRIPERLANASSSYVITEERLSRVTCEPGREVFFRDIEPGRKARREITVTGHVRAFTVDSITVGHPWFAVVDYGGPPPPFVLDPGEKRILTLEYEPRDTIDTFCRIEFAGDLCIGRLLGAYGVWSDAFVQGDRITVVYPNGGERLVAGSRTELRWESVEPDRPVRLEYSTDGGRSWVLIADSATSESHVWDVPNTPGDSCLLRATPASAPIYLGEMVRIPAGSFRMGDSLASAGAEHPDLPVHDITITRPFLMGRTEVTVYQYASIMGDNPSRSDESNHAAMWIRWSDAVQFCNRLSELDGLEPCYAGSGDDITCNFAATGYRLPTEAEWEYACRAGTYEDYYTGRVEHRGGWPLDSALNRAGWYKANADGHVHPVREKQPNDFGLFDMHGNVWEWCWDRYHPEYYRSSPSVDPTGPMTGSLRVLRGGSWDHDAEYCRSSFRGHNIYNNRSHDTGFRIVRAAD